MTPDGAADDAAWNRALLDPLFVDEVERGVADASAGRVVRFPVRARSHTANQAHQPTLERLAWRLDHVARWAALVVLWLGTAYLMAHLLVLAGVGQP